jgi:predicted molibdopterin-dependent oxidoreductase YjgC
VVGEARSEWRLFADVATRVRPDLRSAFSWRDNQTLRKEIARVVPLYAGIETLRDTGDQVQWGGEHLCAEGVFPTDSGRGAFSTLARPEMSLPPGMFAVATRRGKQFNSMVFSEIDPFTGASRDAVYIDPADAAELGFSDGDAVTLTSETGSFEGHLRFIRLPRRSLQIHWPEGNVLIAGGVDHREQASKVPDYNAVVSIARTGVSTGV